MTLTRRDAGEGSRVATTPQSSLPRDLYHAPTTGEGAVHHACATLGRLETYLLTLRGVSLVTPREMRLLRKAFTVAAEKLGESRGSDAAVGRCEALLLELEAAAAANPIGATGDVGPRSVMSPLEPRSPGPFSCDAKPNLLLSIPWQRRAQMGLVAVTLFFTGIPLCLALTVFFLWHTWTRPFMVVYLIFLLFRRPQHPRPILAWHNKWSGWAHYRDYFPVRLFVTPGAKATIRPDGHYFFCSHPHGVHSFGPCTNFVTDSNGLSKELPGLRVHLQAVAANEKIPFWCERLCAAGMGDTSKKCILQTLDPNGAPGESVVVVLGGAEESMLARPGTCDLVLAKRKGFVKLALQVGSPLVPVFNFGENEVYENLTPGHPRLLRLLRWTQKKAGFAIFAFRGRSVFSYSWGLIPHRRPIVTVVGAPVEVPCIPFPTDEDVSFWHERYVQALSDLYSEYADVFETTSKRRACLVA